MGWQGAVPAGAAGTGWTSCPHPGHQELPASVHRAQSKSQKHFIQQIITTLTTGRFQATGYNISAASLLPLAGFRPKYRSRSSWQPAATSGTAERTWGRQQH